MKTFITDDFLLHSDVARELYHDHAKLQPIYDFHSHLPPRQIAENHTFADLTEIWLAGDHYKWRAMRWNGVPEKFCTGDATPWEKFLAFARTVPHTVRNPLYHWTHLELERYFGIRELLDETTAKSIWERANEQLKNMPVQEILRRFNVVVSCTTDDPVSELAEHRRIRDEGKLSTRVYPTFRPDGALNVSDMIAFNSWVEKLAKVSGIACKNFDEFLAALRQRHDFFHEMGGRLSDHGLNALSDGGLGACDWEGTKDEAAKTFSDLRAGKRPPHAGLEENFRAYMMLFFGCLDAERGWTKQLHLGAIRNNNTKIMAAVGADAGADSIGDFCQAEGLSRYLNMLSRADKLPKMVLYNLNPADNYIFAAMAGNFQDGSIPGKIQFGSGWWFLDQKEAMEWQINALSNIGLLSRFVGMLTDSRSFLSFPRHEYFRRVLCNLIGRDVVNGELPHDMKLLGGMVENICFNNARDFFGLKLNQQA